MLMIPPARRREFQEPQVSAPSSYAPSNPANQMVVT
jgi:hypothetical protein